MRYYLALFSITMFISGCGKELQLPQVNLPTPDLSVSNLSPDSNSQASSTVVATSTSTATSTGTDTSTGTSTDPSPTTVAWTTHCTDAAGVFDFTATTYALDLHQDIVCKLNLAGVITTMSETLSYSYYPSVGVLCDFFHGNPSALPQKYIFQIPASHTDGTISSDRDFVGVTQYNNANQPINYTQLTCN